jgi:hypothetical protein
LTRDHGLVVGRGETGYGVTNLRSVWLNDSSGGDGNIAADDERIDVKFLFVISSS